MMEQYLYEYDQHGHAGSAIFGLKIQLKRSKDISELGFQITKNLKTTRNFKLEKNILDEPVHSLREEKKLILLSLEVRN